MSKNKRNRNRTPTDKKPAAAPLLPPPPAQAFASHRYRWVALAVAAVTLATIGYVWWTRPRAPTAVSSVGPAARETARAAFVGAGACAGCHATESAAWQDSKHAKAMQHATAATVLGDFNNASFTYNGIVSSFFRRAGKFFVTTDGAENALPPPFG